MKPYWIEVNDLMQQHYTYRVTEPEGKNFHAGFEPDLSPKEMLELGVFGGKYMNDCRDEFPEKWFKNAKALCRRMTPNSTFSGSTLHSRYRSGAKGLDL